MTGAPHSSIISWPPVESLLSSHRRTLPRERPTFMFHPIASHARRALPVSSVRPASGVGRPPSVVAAPLHGVRVRLPLTHHRRCSLTPSRTSTHRRHTAWICRGRQPHTMSALPADEVEVVWALDFDGVLCDSVGESALSGWKAALIQWPELFGSAEAVAKKAEVLEAMRLSRPVVETGWENVVMIRALRDGKTAEEILENWETLLPEYMQEWDLERLKLLELFGGTRDSWMEEDLDGWLGANRFYPGIPEATRIAMENPKGRVYIVTTKQARFTHTLMNDMANLPVDLEDIYSTAESGSPKSDILKMLMERHPNAKSYRFFEDKLGTLEKVVRLDSMAPWELYLVDWGYNTHKEKQIAEAHPRMQLIGKEGYTKAMQL